MEARKVLNIAASDDLVCWRGWFAPPRHRSRSICLFGGRRVDSGNVGELTQVKREGRVRLLVVLRHRPAISTPDHRRTRHDLCRE